MPATATATATATVADIPALNTQCGVCGKVGRPRSVIADLCLDCFDAYVFACEDCDAPVFDSRHGVRFATRNNFRRGINGLCSRCDNAREYNTYTRGGFWFPSPFPATFATYRRIGSTRKYGVEIETSSCRGFRRLRGRTVFGCKEDCTIRGQEFDSPILYGDEGFDCIAEFLAFANASNWKVNRTCGCHTHYDMRDESTDQLLSIVYAYRVFYSLWASFVPSHRANGEYSGKPCWDAASFRTVCRTDTTFDRVIGRLGADRYEFLNVWSYGPHKTLEVRALEGTLDAETICNWVACNCRFMDAVRGLSLDEIDALEPWPFMVEAVGPNLSNWLRQRREVFWTRLDPLPIIW